MKKIKILNLYACLGGNRYKWDEVCDIQVTAVEYDENLAAEYKKRFPDDIVVIGDAHDYLLKHFKEFDFIWSSPPCPSHSRIRISQKNKPSFKYLYPSMQLYEEILFLDNFFKGLYCVENVVPYYKPLINGKIRGRHIYWTNFNLPSILTQRVLPGGLCNMCDEHKILSNFHDIDVPYNLGGYKSVLRNLVDYEVGFNILKTAYCFMSNKNFYQSELSLF
jgi:DNA (cytosine-5)-methyltransferase 1